ncbi:BRO-N domain-containing protein [Flavobacterium soyangense]|uniref:Bro-N domain-containing protein n=1 Tax=Flavobacterium soyangense TaxID=2023265 RepID=A0A930UB18_9FLAO|nr:Bro-N domain-containing protein [Flavobacterium soyangense]MBF2707504.1 Bro-N domain-containing protein [Flavobacterium soyangense]
MQTENLTPIAFQFSATRQDLNSILIENEPWFVAKDICDILELGNVTKALYALDEDEKLTLPIVRAGQNRKVNCISESGLFALIMRSNKPEAKAFRKWVTSEVLPALRKNGFYGNSKKSIDFIDARDIPYTQVLFNETPVRTITIKEIPYYSLNDYHAAIKSRTESSQAAKKLNKVQPLAVKIWLFGNTHPAWFTTLQGLQLIASGSRVFHSSNQLSLVL